MPHSPRVGGRAGKRAHAHPVVCDEGTVTSNPFSQESRSSVGQSGRSPSPFPCPYAGPKDRGLSNLQDASSILAGSSCFFQARMGVGRAPPGTVAQQRCTEHGVAALASMVHEDGAVRTHDDAMRVRLPSVRAPSPSDGGEGPSAPLCPRCTQSVRADARGLSGSHRVRIPTRPRPSHHSSGSPPLGYPFRSWVAWHDCQAPRRTNSSARDQGVRLVEPIKESDPLDRSRSLTP